LPPPTHVSARGFRDGLRAGGHRIGIDQHEIGAQARREAKAVSANPAQAPPVV
jgi:hypothetical protein